MIFTFKLTKVLTVVLSILLAIIFDQCSKIFISQLMFANSFSNISIFSFFDLVFVRNTGVSFGMFSESGKFGRYFFSIFSISVGLIVAFLAILNDKKLITIALSLVASGAIANALDRIYFGGVIDFIDIFVYNLHWPAFNFADIFITLGVILLIFDNFYYKYEK